MEEDLDKIREAKIALLQIGDEILVNVTGYNKPSIRFYSEIYVITDKSIIVKLLNIHTCCYERKRISKESIEMNSSTYKLFISSSRFGGNYILK